MSAGGPSPISLSTPSRNSSPAKGPSRGTSQAMCGKSPTTSRVTMPVFMGLATGTKGSGTGRREGGAASTLGRAIHRPRRLSVRASAVVAHGMTTVSQLSHHLPGSSALACSDSQVRGHSNAKRTKGSPIDDTVPCPRALDVRARERRGRIAGRSWVPAISRSRSCRRPRCARRAGARRAGGTTKCWAAAW